MVKTSALLVVVLLAACNLRGVEISRETCDRLIPELPDKDPWEPVHDASVLAWGESYTIHALVDMYEATGDAKYLLQAVRRGDRELSHRDDQRNFADYSGKVHKRWSIGTKYTVAEATLVDADGKGVIKLRSTLYAFNDQTKVSVSTTRAGFTIHLTNAHWKRDETFADLSMDPESPRYFATVINDEKPRPRPNCSPGTCTSASQLLRATATDEKAAAAPKEQSLSLTPLWESHTGYVGIIYHPLLRLAQIVKAEPKLSPELQQAADRFIAAAEESFDELKTSFRDGPREGEGYYVNDDRGGAAPYDGAGLPFNYLGKLSSSQLILFQLTGKPIYQEHVTKMATLLHRRLRLVDGNRYLWDYWYEPVTLGWTRADNISVNTPFLEPSRSVEDVSHATLEVEMAVNCAAAGIVFDQTDLQRFANTFTMKVVNVDHTNFNGHVDGSDPKSGLAITRVNGWLPLAVADRKVFDLAREVYLARNKDDVRDAARLLKWQEALERSSR